MKIIADRFIPFLQGRLEPFADVEYIHPDSFTPHAVRDADALLIRTRTKCNAELLTGSKVQMIATATIGMDQFDLPWCARSGIATYNSPGCNAPAVAQYVWSSLLHIGIDPTSCTIGVVGHGSVGSIVADWGRKLGAKVLVCDPPKAATALLYESIPLRELAAGCDIITLHTPLTRSGKYATYHMIESDVLSAMKPGAILINAARGPVVDSQAVATAASKKGLRLITDCWEGEPSDLHPQILRLSQIATPHIAGYSLQGKQRATRMVCESVARHFHLPLADTPSKEGIKVWDLPAPYTPWPSINATDIYNSYDPVSETLRLKADPTCFEAWRDSYDYRDEVYMGDKKN